MLLAGVEIFSRSQGGTAAAQGALKVSRFVQWRAGFFAASGTKPDTVGFRRDYFGDGGGGRACGMRRIYIDRYKLPSDDRHFSPDAVVADFESLLGERLQIVCG